MPFVLWGCLWALLVLAVPSIADDELSESLEEEKSVLEAEAPPEPPAELPPIPQAENVNLKDVIEKPLQEALPQVQPVPPPPPSEVSTVSPPVVEYPDNFPPAPGTEPTAEIVPAPEPPPPPAPPPRRLSLCVCWARRFCRAHPRASPGR
ncbi:MAG: hypothetical protein NVV73_02125 [Cellvibrionaceae bacterium]|nr:hypothetical protein [Cellvibrionaceae bacterium]